MRPQIKQTLADLERQRQSEPADLPVDQRMLPVGPEAALFLNSVIRAARSKTVVEVGGSMGYSTIWLAEAAEANGGRLISLEFLPNKAAAIRKRVAQAGLDHTVEVRHADALESLRDLPAPFDFVLID